MQQERHSASGENLAAVSENYDGTMDDLTNTNKDNNSNYGHNEKKGRSQKCSFPLKVTHNYGSSKNDG